MTDREQSPEIAVERSMNLDAAPEVVWRYITDGSLATEWMGSPISIDPRVGGKIDFAPDGEEYLGTVEAVEEGRSISWSWRHPDRDPSQVTIRVDPDEDGSRVTVIERLIAFQITDARPGFEQPGLPVVYAALLAA